MVRIICLFCKSRQDVEELYAATFHKKNLTAQTYSARRLPDRVHYRIIRCRRCGLVFSSPILPPTKISSLYRQSTCTYTDQIPYTTKTYVELFDRIRKILPTKPKVLEVGCGNGFFLSAVANKGVTNVWGVEPGIAMVQDAPKILRKRIITDIFKPGQFRKESFDLVCCFHTLDHMTDPAGFAQTTFGYLKPGGIALVVVHDADGLSVKLFGGKSPIFDIEHIYLFNRTTLTRLFSDHGFTAPTAQPLRNTYPLTYWITMSGLPDRMKSLFQHVLSRLGLASLPLTLAGGNLWLAAQKPQARTL